MKQKKKRKGCSTLAPARKERRMGCVTLLAPERKERRKGLIVQHRQQKWRERKRLRGAAGGSNREQQKGKRRKRLCNENAGKGKREGNQKGCATAPERKERENDCTILPLAATENKGKGGTVRSHLHR